jgi:uncharacterized protein (TIGR00299 family) protein
MTLYLECAMGAAGDMLMGALLELLPDPDAFLAELSGLGLKNVRVTRETSVKCGIRGTKMRVFVDGVEEGTGHDKHLDRHDHEHIHDHDHDHNHHDEHEHTHDQDHDHHHHDHHPFLHTHDVSGHHGHDHFSFADIAGIISALSLPDTVKKDAVAVYRLLGEAEATVHGAPLEEIHFHEVGTMDAVVDIVGCCLLFHKLGAKRVLASPVHVGFGMTRCSHGLMPVPAPATARLLEGIPVYAGSIRGELCTPTGAALLRHFVDEFGPMPPMRIEKIGYGMGTKDFIAPNCVRAFLAAPEPEQDTVCSLSCNLDDMTPEAIGYAMEQLLAAGALDVFTTPISMKKNRPAVMLTCLCRPEQREVFSRLIFRHTSTIGVRYTTLRRDVLERTTLAVETPYGAIRIKISRGEEGRKIKPEYDDVAAAALREGVPFSEVHAAALRAAQSSI